MAWERIKRLDCIAFNMAATKISSDCTCELEKSLNWQEKRSEVCKNILDPHCNVWIMKMFF